MLHIHGWRQGDYGNAECGFCSIGAISESALVHDPRDGYYAARGAFCGAIGTGSVARWNDAPGRTFEEVEAAFLRAIEIAKAEE